MKKTTILLLFSIFFYASAQNFDAQSGVYDKQTSEDIQPNSRRAWTSKRSPQSPIWVPYKGVEYYSSDTMTPYYFIHYKHNKEGKLLSEFREPNKEHPYNDYPVLREYNGAFLMEGKDVIDTITVYQKYDHSIPLERTYYSYHYYDIFEQDSFYVDEIIQVWNSYQKKWIDDYRYRYQFTDTVYWGFRGDETYNSRGSGNLVQTSGLKQMLAYDDRGNVIQYINYSYDEETKEYKEYTLETYQYDDEGVMRERILYYSDDAGGWIAIEKMADIEWKEWHGYICFPRIGAVNCLEFYMPFEQVIGDKRNKMSNSTNYAYKNSQWTKSNKGEYDWNINGTLSNTYTISEFTGDENPCKTSERYHLLNERGDFIAYKLVGYTRPDENGEQKISYYAGCYYQYIYDEEKECLKEYGFWNLSLNSSQAIDSSLKRRIIVTDFVDATTVGITETQDTGCFLFYPNPARETIFISAAESLEQIAVYDLSGRLLKEDFPKAQQTELQVGNLAPGVYLLKARLKNGAVRTEKLIIQ